MKLQDLYVLMAVVQAGSMRKAAAQLNTTQPSISRSIAELEHTVGVQLLDRNPQGVEPTQYGRALLDCGTTVFDDLHQGSHVLLFPEGTRTTRFPVGPLQGTTGLIAKNAGVPVQTVFIETDSGFLGKGWSLLWTPRMPITYRVRLGKRFEAPTHSARFIAELQSYFESELAHARLPEFPIPRPRA